MPTPTMNRVGLEAHEVLQELAARMRAAHAMLGLIPCLGGISHFKPPAGDVASYPLQLVA